MTMIEKRALLESLGGLRDVPVLIVGDIMLDHYQWGWADRISPEAPVPVVSVERETWKLGGAGNVARNVKRLGGSPCLVSMVGDDAAGAKIEGLLDDKNIEHHLVRTKRPTTIKTRIIAGSQQMLRVDQEKKGRMSPATRERFAKTLGARGKNVGSGVVSDYGKGVICPEVLGILRGCLPNGRVFVDPKIENYGIYGDHYLMTPNAKEAAESVQGSMETPLEILGVGRRIIAEKNLQNLLITLGGRGMVLFSEDGRVAHIPTVAQDVFDVTGAGDTVIGVLALCLSAGMDLLTGCVLANCAAGIVVGQVGTAAVELDDLVRWLEGSRLPEISYWHEMEG
ncbi:bifunctional heptose 7-phosphate kinase/heptose 1-phosphate adenyltransferase [Desulfoplanes sp.]